MAISLDKPLIISYIISIELEVRFGTRRPLEEMGMDFYYYDG